MENDFEDNAELEGQEWAAGDNALIHWDHFREERVEEGRGDFIILWDAEEEVVDPNVRNEAAREMRRRRRRPVDLERLRRAWMELEAQESAGSPDPQTSGKRQRTEEGETSGQSKKRTPKKRRKKRTKKR